MKLSKKLKILRGVTAVRVKLGLTQLALAQYLGISKSLVSMVENGHRNLSSASLAKLAGLETGIDIEQLTGEESPTDQNPLREPAQVDSFRSARKKINALYILELQYRLNIMNNRCTEITGSLLKQERLLQMQAGRANQVLVQQHKLLCKKLKSCDETARLKLRSKIVMLHLIITGKETAETFKTSMRAIEIPALAC